MPKLKTNKSIAKRVRVTKNGKVIRNRAGRRHLLSVKNSKRRRHLRTKAQVNPTYAKGYISVIHI